MPFPVQRPVIGIAEDPDSSSTLARVEICHRPKNIEEYGLRHVLRFARVTNDAACHFENQATIAVEQYAKGVVAAGRHLLHQLLI